MIRTSLASPTSVVLSGLVLGLVTGCFATRDLTSYSEGGPSDSSVPEPETPVEVARGGGGGAAVPVVRPPPPDAGPMLTEALDPEEIDLEPAPVKPSPTTASACDGEGEFAGAASGECYRLLAMTSSWLDARAECQRWGADLAEMTGPEENEFLDARFLDDVWLGATRSGDGGPFVWSSGRPFEYENWLPGQPDDFRGQEDCVVMRPGGLWNDSPCAGPKYGLCERDGSR